MQEQPTTDQTLNNLLEKNTTQTPILNNGNSLEIGNNLINKQIPYQLPPTYQYQQNIATRIEFEEGDIDNIESRVEFIKNTLLAKSIINIYGLSGSGKGTLSRSLGQQLGVSCLDSGQIFRALTYAFNHTGLENNVVNTANLLNQIKITLEDSKLRFEFENEVLGLDKLRSTHVNKRIADFASKDYVQLAYFDKIYEIIEDYGRPVILDGRGGKPPHLIKAENNDFKVFKMLLEVDNQTNFERQLTEKAIKARATDSSFVVDADFQEQVKRDFMEGYVMRNQKDIDWMTKMDIGIVVPGAILDTSRLSPKQVLATAIKYLYNQLILN